MAVAAGPIAGMGELAVVAPFDGAAQQRRTAGLDGLHQTVLMQGQGMSLPVRRAKLSKDVGQLRGWLRQDLWPALAFAGVTIQVVERTDGGVQSDL